MEIEYTEIFSDVFDGMECDNPNCDHGDDEDAFFIHSRCHIAGRVEVFLSKGYLHVRCYECEAPIIKMKVPERSKNDGDK